MHLGMHMFIGMYVICTCKYVCMLLLEQPPIVLLCSTIIFMYCCRCCNCTCCYCLVKHTTSQPTTSTIALALAGVGVMSFKHLDSQMWKKYGLTAKTAIATKYATNNKIN